MYGCFRAAANAALMGAVLFLAAGAGAAEEAEQQAAEALFRQAKSLMENDELEAACEKFAASHALDPGVGTLLYLGDCYERAGRLASAAATFDAASKLARSRGDKQRERLASVRHAALEPRVPTLEVRGGTRTRPRDLQITVNGVPLLESDIDRRTPRDAGPYELRFSAPGYETFVSHVELKNGANGGVVVPIPRLVRSVLRAPVSDSSAAVPVDAETGQGQRLAGWIVGASGVGFGIAAGVLSLLAQSKHEDSKAGCDPASPNRCGPEGVRLREDAQSLATLATVAGALGGAALTGGLVLYLTAPASDEVVPSGASVSLGGTF